MVCRPPAWQDFDWSPRGSATGTSCTSSHRSSRGAPERDERDCATAPFRRLRRVASSPKSACSVVSKALKVGKASGSPNSACSVGSRTQKVVKSHGKPIVLRGCGRDVGKVTPRAGDVASASAAPRVENAAAIAASIPAATSAGSVPVLEIDTDTREADAPATVSSVSSKCARKSQAKRLASWQSAASTPERGGNTRRSYRDISGYRTDHVSWPYGPTGPFAIGLGRSAGGSDSARPVVVRFRSRSHSRTAGQLRMDSPLRNLRTLPFSSPGGSENASAQSCVAAANTPSHSVPTLPSTRSRVASPALQLKPSAGSCVTDLTSPPNSPRSFILPSSSDGSPPTTLPRPKVPADERPLVASGADERRGRRKALHPALEKFRRLPQAERITGFWRFVTEAVRGLNSEEPLCREFSLGGAVPLLVDVFTVADEILLKYSHDLGEQIWHVFIVVWLGAGGPGFRSYRHVTKGALLCGESCPQECRLPSLRADVDVLAFYEHIAGMADRHGRTAVFSGDGTSVKFRLNNDQGVSVLRSWRRCAALLADLAGGTHEGFAALGPKAIDAHLSATPWMGPLTIKEIFCYLYPAHPTAIDVDVYLPVGGGAMRGGCIVLGLEGKAASKADWHKQFLDMATNIPPELAVHLAEAIRAQGARFPTYEHPYLSGASAQLKSGRVTAADVEVCMCFFMNFLKAKHTGSVPAGWSMLRRSSW